MPEQTGALPTYLRIAEGLTREIGAGRLAPGHKLAPERRMAAEHGVAVATLRKALQVLADRGLIERRQGSGNYILNNSAQVGTYALFRLERPGGGGLPTAQLLDLAEAPKPVDLPHLDTHATAIRIRRLRFLSDVPVAVEEIWLSRRWYDPAAMTSGTVSESLYRTYRDRLGLHIERAEDVIGAGPLPDWTPEAFGQSPAVSLIKIERRAYDQHGAPCEASWTWYDPARARYCASVP